MEESIKTFLENLKNVNIDDKLVTPENEQVLMLAFIGDTIFDMFTRDTLIRKYHDKLKMNDLHKKNVELVCAKSQAKIIEKLMDDNVLNDEEIEYFKHARNAHPHSKSKNSSIVEYRKATGFESLLGLLFYTNKIDRLVEIFKKISDQDIFK